MTLEKQILEIISDCEKANDHHTPIVLKALLFAVRSDDRQIMDALCDTCRDFTITFSKYKSN